MRTLRLAAALAAAAIATAAPAVARCGPPSGRIGVLLGAINGPRAGRRERPLALENRLCTLATEHAVDMLEHRYLSHYSQDGRSPFARMAAAHYRWHYAAENLALDVSERAIARDFLASPEHRRNILRPQFRHVGIAAVTRADGEVIVVEDFSD